MERSPGCNGAVPWWNVPERNSPNSYCHCGENPVPHGTARNGIFRNAWIRPVRRLPQRNHLLSQFIFCTSAMTRFSCFSPLHLFRNLDFALPSTLFLSDTVVSLETVDTVSRVPTEMLCYQIMSRVDWPDRSGRVPMVPPVCSRYSAGWWRLLTNAGPPDGRRSLER